MAFFFLTFEVDGILNQKTVQWQHFFLLNIEINKIVCFFFFFCLCQFVLLFVLQSKFQPELGTFSQAFQAKAIKKFKREKIEN